MASTLQPCPAESCDWNSSTRVVRMAPSQGFNGFLSREGWMAVTVVTGWRCRFRPIWGEVRPERRRTRGVESVPAEMITRGAFMVTCRVVRGPATPPWASREVQVPVMPVAVRVLLMVSKIIFEQEKPSMN